MKPDPKRKESGAALLTVLLLVAVMSVVAAAALERVTLATRLTGNAGALGQARAFSDAAETIARMRVTDLVRAQPGRTSLRGNWLGRPQSLPVPQGSATARVFDGGNCFNLNSVVSGKSETVFTVRPSGVSQFQALMRALGIPANQAQMVATSLADWIDTDDVPQPGGAEDSVYLGRPVPYRTANRLMVDASELRVVNGVTPAIYQILQPWVCALPTSDLSPININTLLPTQAPLFAMLLPGMSVDQARQYLAQRPGDGYGGLPEFWRMPQQAGFTPEGEVNQQVKLTTRWFRVEILVQIGGTEVNETALIDAQPSPAVIVRRQWGEGV